MQSLRQARLLARLVLVWFVLALGVAVASPIVQPQGVQLVCASGGAMKLVVQGDDGATEVQPQTLDCPLCLCGHAPPTASGQRDGAMVELQVQTLWSVHPALRVSRTAASLPPRGPPRFS